MHLTLVSLLILVVIAGICGWLGQALAGSRNLGFITSAVLGFIGALLGAWIAGAAKLPEIFALDVGGEHFPIVWSIVGAALLGVAINLLSRRHRRLFA